MFTRIMRMGTWPTFNSSTWTPLAQVHQLDLPCFQFAELALSLASAMEPGGGRPMEKETS